MSDEKGLGVAPQAPPLMQGFAPEPVPVSAKGAIANALVALADRCEQASSGDRDLDAEIMFDLYAKPCGVKADGGPTGYIWPEDNPSWNLGIRFPGKEREWFFRGKPPEDSERLIIWRDGAWVRMNDIRIPKFTASLDAGLTLVPSDHAVRLETAVGSRVYANVWNDTADYDGIPKNEARAATPALALCAASLRARASLSGDL